MANEILKRYIERSWALLDWMASEGIFSPKLDDPADVLCEVSDELGLEHGWEDGPEKLMALCVGPHRQRNDNPACGDQPRNPVDSGDGVPGIVGQRPGSMRG